MNYPTVNPFLSSGATGDARNAASTRSADLAAAQDDHLIRRSDSPIANSPSKSSGSASVSGPSPLAKPAGVVAAPVGERANGLAPVSPGNGKDAATDSISLAQLKQITAVLPKARVSLQLLAEAQRIRTRTEIPLFSCSNRCTLFPLLRPTRTLSSTKSKSSTLTWKYRKCSNTKDRSKNPGLCPPVSFSLGQPRLSLTLSRLARLLRYSKATATRPHQTPSRGIDEHRSGSTLHRRSQRSLHRTGYVALS